VNRRTEMNGHMARAKDDSDRYEHNAKCEAQSAKQDNELSGCRAVSFQRGCGPEQEEEG
jgi:hypothetical protein